MTHSAALTARNRRPIISSVPAAAGAGAPETIFRAERCTTPGAGDIVPHKPGAAAPWAIVRLDAFRRADGVVARIERTVLDRQPRAIAERRCRELNARMHRERANARGNGA